MRLEKHRYDDIVILRFVGEFDTFNLPAFSERIDRMIEQGDTLMILDLQLLKFVNSAALGYLIKTSKAVAEKGGELVLARPSKNVKKALSTLGLESVFKGYATVEDAIRHLKQGEEIGEIDLGTGEYDESLTGAVPILFRPLSEGDDAPPNQVGRIVTLYEDGLLFRYEPEAEGDPVKSQLTPGAKLKLKFRQPFAVKDYYFQMSADVVESNQMGDEDSSVLTTRVRYGEIDEKDRVHLEQFVRDQEAWKDELPQG